MSQQWRSQTPRSRNPAKTNGEKSKSDENPNNAAKYVPELYLGWFSDLADKQFTERGVKRCLSRPIEDYGGSIWCAAWLIFLPLYTVYWYGIIVLPNVNGQLIEPWNMEFWSSLWNDLPEGISLKPTWEATGFWVGWIVLQALLEAFVPIWRVDLGVEMKNGLRVPYVMNGLRCFALSHLILGAAVYCDVLEPTYIWRNMGALVTVSLIGTYLVALWVYVDYGIFWWRHADKPEFEEDTGVFDYRMIVSDYFCGVTRHPRAFHKYLAYPFDIKRFSNARPGLSGWVLWNWSLLAGTYYKCRLETSVASGYQAVCDASGSFDNVPLCGILIALSHWYYIADYNWFEPAYLTTTDIRHDLYGWALAFGCLAFVQFYYPISFLNWIVWQRTPLLDNFLYVGIGALMMAIGTVLFRLSNIQKHEFRSYIQEGGDLSKYKVWGEPVKYMKTKRGSYLLLSGFWGLARHFNYIGDLVMCVGWTIMCYSPNNPFPWAPLSYVAYFWVMDIHRMYRDELRCAKKYEEDWITYKQKVKYWLFPGIF